MKRLFIHIKTILLIVLPALIFMGCSATKQLTSQAPNTKIVIDGQSDEWEGKLRYIEDEKCAVGFQNDSDYFYICLETSDRTKILKILGVGFTTWFIPQDGKILGVRYPLKRQFGNEIPYKQHRIQSNFGTKNSDALSNRIKELLNEQPELQIINQDEFPLYAYSIADHNGFQVSLGLAMEKLIYELRVPIGENKLAPVILNVYPGESLEVNFETNEIDFTASGQRGGGISSGGAAPPGGFGKRGSGTGGIRQNGNFNSADPHEQFELNLEVILVE